MSFAIYLIFCVC